MSRAFARAVAALCLFGAIACGVHTSPFKDPRGQVVPGSVATMADVVIGGVEQRLWFRAADAANPAVIVLHGGPGASATALFRHYNAELEQHFLMVYWDQRGTGRSYHSDIPAESMTITQFVKDLDEVVDLVRGRFAKDKVVLLGHSWGSALGLLYAARFPEKVAAYVGFGQAADMRQGERLSYEFARAEASRRNHRGALGELERIGWPPHDVDEMLTSRKWMERFGGAFHGDLSKGKLIWAALGTDEANLVDLIKFGQGNRFSLTHLWDEFREFDVDETLVTFRTPIVFLLGGTTSRCPPSLRRATSTGSRRRRSASCGSSNPRTIPHSKSRSCSTKRSSMFSSRLARTYSRPGSVARARLHD